MSKKDKRGEKPMTTDIINISKGIDRNSNSIARVLCEHGGFAVQTHNLPITYEMGIGDWTEQEIAEYVAAFGTDQQKNLVRMVI